MVPDDAEAFAAAIARCLASPQEWASRRAAALEYARGYDWTTLLDRALRPMGFVRLG